MVFGASRCKFCLGDMVLVDYKGTKYLMCVMRINKRDKQLYVKSLRFDNFALTVGFDEVKKIVDL